MHGGLNASLTPQSLKNNLVVSLSLINKFHQDRLNHEKKQKGAFAPSILL